MYRAVVVKEMCTIRGQRCETMTLCINLTDELSQVQRKFDNEK
jgi:hypothetical protein